MSAHMPVSALSEPARENFKNKKRGRICESMQMQWSKHGAHLPLQALAKTLNREWAVVFKHWYPDLAVEEWEKAA